MQSKMFFVFKIALLAVSMLVAVIAMPSEADANEYYYNSNSTPCPHWSIDDVLADLHGDWDHDRVSNSDEVWHAGLNPCKSDSAKWCANNQGCQKTYYYYTPAPKRHHHNTTYYYVPQPAATTYVVHNPCSSSWSWNYVNANPHGDWDHDGVTNHTEAKHGANPCAKPCGYPTNTDVALNPHGDWDGDGHTNNTEAKAHTNPCNASSRPVVQRLPHITYTPVITYQPTVTYQPQRLPHVNTPRCPAGYPHYHAGNGKCYANPVRNTGW